MSAANTDYLQATIEVFGFFIIIVIAMVFRIITGNEKKSEKYLFTVLLFSGLALLLDAGWYIYDGNTSNSALILNWWSNFLIFLCNPVVLILFNRYLCQIIVEKKYAPDKRLVIIINVLLLLTFMIPVSNLFYNWMYYFDSYNIYHRMSGWYVYTVLNCMGIIANIIMVIIYRKFISKRRRATLYIFLLAPFVGIALQSTNIGISFIQIGIALGSFGILISYLVEWIQIETNESDISEDRKRLWIIECIFSIMILFISASIISCVVSIHKVANKNSEQSSRALLYMVSETVDGALSEPIDVSRTMAESCAIRDALKMDKLEGSHEEADMLSFMKRIKEEYDYQMIFVASEKSKAYYTYDGISRYMDVDNDIKDAWYNEFKNRNIQYELNIDEDKDNDMSLAVFVNIEVRGDNNEFLGVCGVGTSVESLINILSQYEKDYSLDICFSDKNGFIQLDTSENMIGRRHNYDITPSEDSELVHYTRNKVRARLTKYMKGLNWYLIVDDNNPDKLDIVDIIAPSVIIYIIGILFMVSFSILFGILEKRRSNQLRTSKILSETDRLTGVKNRNAFENFQKSIESDLVQDRSMCIVMMDINGLKTVNDKYGHVAGDELIIGATNCIRKELGKYGDIYRVGGDEFVFISYEEETLIKEVLGLLSKRIGSWKGDLVSELAISIGMASSFEAPDKSFNELLKMADERMYSDKNAYYRRTGKDRRMSW